MDWEEGGSAFRQISCRVRLKLSDMSLYDTAFDEGASPGSGEAASMDLFASQLTWFSSRCVNMVVSCFY